MSSSSSDDYSTSDDSSTSDHHSTSAQVRVRSMLDFRLGMAFASIHLSPTQLVIRVCRRNRLLKDVSIVRYHLYANGIDKSYKIWFWHCEDLNSETSSSRMENTVDENYEHNDLFNTVNMFQSAHDQSCNISNTLDTMFDDAKKPLYPRCKKFTKL
ncbi:hypothetical protein E6C27_scaffold22G005430 [Cucumis melo var. makuwa]|uniref:Uncharacterized protein n=1 Tax=Cucumis melo var. makuwa TaxID=1194695 RepID=A0A5A7UXG7_CUCMM|nr:hypothetical protein E6C27_scaffold316G001390 [Cucumis melo var. makuwa]KAA0060653.1 hypothetical protein E6C27_scaffold22G005430 [Cucumis melo var. makuwa]